MPGLGARHGPELKQGPYVVQALCPRLGRWRGSSLRQRPVEPVAFDFSDSCDEDCQHSATRDRSYRLPARGGSCVASMKMHVGWLAGASDLQG